jgi:NAD(P)-dependent dehydrogenase (short-subunit alcohol dehydrogenase family)
MTTVSGPAAGGVSGLEGQPERPADPFSLAGRHALITGGARGIGYATALRMLEAGASVMVSDIDAAALDDAVHRLQAEGFPVESEMADVGDLSQIQRLVERTVAALGSLDVLVNNAGTFQPTPLDALDPKLVDRMFDVNTKGLLYMSAEAVKVMPPGSAIVHVSSLGGIRPPFTGLSAYHATKGAIDSLTRDMALEWGRRGIRVNSVAPGGILTEGGGQVTEHPLFPPDRMAGIMARARSRPLGRMGYADDPALAVVFLASPAAGFITGQQLLVDGGYYLA